MSEVLDVVKPQAQSSGRETTIKAMTQNGRCLDRGEVAAKIWSATAGSVMAPKPKPCRSPVDGGDGKLARASAPLSFGSMTCQKAESFALDGGSGRIFDGRQKGKAQAAGGTWPKLLQPGRGVAGDAHLAASDVAVGSENVNELPRWRSEAHDEESIRRICRLSGKSQDGTTGAAFKGIRPSQKPEADANVSFLAEGLIGVLSFLIRIIGRGHWKVADSFSIRIDYQR
jgi:hypothetical protein